MRCACWAVTKVGLAIQEWSTKSTTKLHRESTSEFMELIDKMDIVLLCQQHLRTDAPLTDEIATIKSVLKRDYVTSMDKVRTVL